MLVFHKYLLGKKIWEDVSRFCASKMELDFFIFFNFSSFPGDGGN